VAWDQKEICGMMNLPGEKKYAILTTPGEAETGSAGEQPVMEYRY